ncbi:MAG: bifunctional methylenetetrahydrofolate dehydrogenase/methenyltetrahydrofolate cyclohydrolase FolD [Methanoculleus sp.]|uniref:bifunctional methylenetetrahydrofolate dehydrogenase/methenyltetrahydrofolate cyclohydrolase FolD n=1 Tax=Methanoculleus sp. TaxID=90427 RepID=UPI0025D0E2B0|nr:bifunctional methylenetetrahydrofolate dehydrogenase/methenyltetrahydrofolate cyclohydrolase FolD [Methanoculleus sp.]MCK9317572.1 bifunctional methylenetetrahydrofolate dehydrogenase/methenyltetrahydrofolate cyclohydrolase FolD [Methanoculleus sp.]MDD2254139.1 bifunctional methylenetetrahydrofolate dehydrogenase/methenyltetrahydrofolate cyclohydrolase FolD [Methanoculleus sp.]MDD3215848.1 bifunctional methylenetetrahydrofolate dehydrogenase/methenyltetrahydrofolate cyclohydrolase FolD [Metha
MILDGKAVSEKRLEILKEKIEESRLYPRLATIIVGEDPGSKLYVRMKHRACERVGIGSVGIELPEDASTERVLETVTRLNNDPEIDGILVQLPLPSGVDTTRVINAVAPGKDVDGFHPCNLGRLLAGTPVFAPCTPQGIMTILDEYKIPIAGKRAVVVGRSIDVGRPMAALLLNADATVTICHSKTRNLEDEMRNADILVSAIGKLKFVGTDMIKAGATVIDVGINYDEQGKLHGDVDFEAVRDRAGAITPVPGGVGPMTIATLMENTFLAAKLRTCGTVR